MQNLTLVPDKWCQMYCSEYFNVFEYQKVCKIQGNTDLILGGAQCAELTSLNGTGGLGGGRGDGALCTQEANAFRAIWILKPV